MSRRAPLGSILVVVLLGGGWGGASIAAAAPWPEIRRIVIHNESIFSAADRQAIGTGLMGRLLDPIFLLANATHVDTRAHVIRRELLVREGDPADPERLEESERNLRDLSIIRRVSVTTRDAGPGLVDVHVHAQDTWTTEPRASFSSGGGEQKAEFGIVERNLLGFGKDVSARFQREIDRDSIQLTYEDPRVLGTRWRWKQNFEETSDGRILSTVFEYPFFAVETPYATGVRMGTTRDRGRVFAPREIEASEFRRKAEDLFVSFGARLPMATRDTNWRGGLTYSWSDEDFAFVGSEFQDPSLVPEDHRRSIPGIFLTREEIRFVKERHFSNFDRLEDLNLGNAFSLRLGHSTKALGADLDEPVFLVSDRQGFDLGPGHKAFFFSLLTGRLASGEFRNTVFEIEGISFHRFRLFVEQTFVTRLKIDWGENLDREVQIFLGNDNGLRGFPNRQLVGEKRFVFNLEDRLFFVNDLYRLVSLGGVVFFDAGNVWQTGQPIRLSDLAMSVGLGLRVGAPRAAGEKIWRFDLAVPLRSAAGESFGIGFSFGSGHAFQPFSGPFELQTISN